MCISGCVGLGGMEDLSGESVLWWFVNAECSSQDQREEHHVLIFVHVLICISNVVGALVCLQGDIVEIQLHSVLENIDGGF